MRKPLVYGSLWWLKKQMPAALRIRLDEELKLVDAIIISERKKGETPETLVSQELRYVNEHQPHLRRTSLLLKSILVKYFPVTEDQLLRNEVPKLSDCTYFWGREIARLEKESTKQPVHA